MLLALIIASAPRYVFAYALHLRQESPVVRHRDEFILTVLLDAGEDSNAVDGQIIYDATVFESMDIYEGNSGINFWIESPHEVSPGVITFAGMTPGGFQGNNEKLFALRMKAKKVGTHTISIRGARLYKNDGSGSPSALDMQALSLVVEGESLAPAKMTQLDVEPPEDFTPIIANDHNIYDGKHFIVFKTQDKGLGVDHYEIREGLFGLYVRAESPYLLKRQKVDRPIYIRAIDKEGNVREVVVAPRINVPIWRQGEWISLFVIFAFIFHLLRAGVAHGAVVQFKKVMRQIMRR